MKISVLAFLIICGMTLVGCSSDNKVDSNTNDNEVLNEEIQNPFAVEEIKLRTAEEVKEDYSANRKSIVAKKQINFLDKEEIDKEEVLKYAKNSVIVANGNESTKIAKKKDTVEKLVALDDLHHNTTEDVKKEVMLYALNLWEEGRFMEMITFDEQLEILYLTKYLDLALEDNPIFDAADDIAHNMYLLMDDKVEGKTRRLEKYKENIEPLVESVKGQLESL